MPARRKTNPEPPPPPFSPPSVHLYLQQQQQQQSKQPSLQQPRRATRQTPIPPPPIPPLASRLVPQAQPTSPPQQRPASIISPVSPPLPQTNGQPPAVKRGRGRPSKTSPQPPITSPESRVWPPSTTAIPLPDMASLTMSKENLRPPDLVAPDITYHVPHHHAASAIQPGRASSLVKPQAPSPHPPPRAVPRVAPPTPATITPVPPPKPSTSKPTTAPAPRADRNIDKVVFGSLCFRTWYPSYYGKEVLGDASGNASKLNKEPSSINDAASKKKQDQQHHHMLERLYVCPTCFKYSKELVAWWGHVRICEQQGHVPGTKIYTHPRGRRKVLVPVGDGGVRGSGPINAKKRRGESVRYIEETVEDEGEWSIWEVDGEKDGLFCQNLSLFAKLFLDNKSVFFDVTGFNYFLLVYTPPPPKPADSPSSPNQAAPLIPTANVPNPATTSLARPPTPQVTGFFSKEKMSWDNNNLACILVFPPWQRKGLGALLMSASYEISRREGVMGGPEKPISDLGRKGYRRYWSGEIARWLLGLDATAGPEQEVIVDINDCSQATWIAVEDCLATLRDMGVVEDAGLGPGKPPPPAEDEDENMGDDAPGGDGKPHQTSQGAEVGEDEEKEGSKLVSRVRVDKEAVRRYVAAHGISLERMCDTEGFVEGYAVKQTTTEDEDEDIEME